MSNLASSMMLRIDEIPEIFADVTPVPQNDGPDPVCAINYPASFVLAYDYLRACWKSGEKSERSWKLSATCLKLNPANYTVWHYRRSCMQALRYVTEDAIVDHNNNNNNNNASSDSAEDLARNKQKIQEDLILSSELGGDNPKNYQIWYHRRALLDAFHQKTKTKMVGTVDGTGTSVSASLLEKEFLDVELDYIARVLQVDSKNYHAWSHRQWLLQTVNNPNLWDRELEFGK